MPTLTPYRLVFRGGLHIGTRGVNLEEAGVSIPSDTLFSALLDTWRQSGGDVEMFVKPFTAQPPDPPFLLTSAFPFTGQVLFFPMPLDPTRLFKPETLQARSKDIKRIRYLSLGLLEKALSGQFLGGYLFPEGERDEPEHGVALQGGSLWLSLDEIDLLPSEMRRAKGRRHALRSLRVWSHGRVPRVTIDRYSSASTIYHAGRVAFTQDCGLWFGVQWRNTQAQSGLAAYQPAFEQSLAMLQDDGLGGERSSGYGAFNYQAGQPLTLGNLPQPGQLTYLLSRYHPAQAELPAAMTSEPAAYSLAAVGGWLRSVQAPAQRRKRLFLVSEGSLVTPPASPAGDLVDVRPTYKNTMGDLSHPVYRSGLALGLAWPERPATQGRS